MVGLLVAEVFVRLADVPPRMLDTLRVENFQISPNPKIKFEFRPNFSTGDAGGLDHGHAGFVINSDGYRDREFSVAKPLGVIRIAALGDSTTAGNGTRDVQQTFPKVLERKLNAQDASRAARRFEVMNMGVGGYQTLQAAELFRVKGIKYAPDIVLLTFCINDFDWNADGGVFGRLMNSSEDVDGLESHYELFDSHRSLWSILNHSRLVFVVYHRLRVYLEAPQSLRRRTAVNLRTGIDSHDPVSAGLAILEELRLRHGFKLYVSILPSMERDFENYRHLSIHDRLKGLLAQYPEIRVIDLLDEIPKRHVSWGLTGDGLHLIAPGHELVAQILFERLVADI